MIERNYHGYIDVWRETKDFKLTVFKITPGKDFGVATGSRKFWFVLIGTATVYYKDGTKRVCPAGQFIYVPYIHWQKVVNESEEDLLIHEVEFT